MAREAGIAVEMGCVFAQAKSLVPTCAPPDVKHRRKQKKERKTTVEGYLKGNCPQRSGRLASAMTGVQFNKRGKQKAKEKKKKEKKGKRKEYFGVM